MFNYNNEKRRSFFQTRPSNSNPIQTRFETQQNQKSKISDYKEAIPNRKMTVKRGVFPFAIHANVVSKPRMDNQSITINNNYQASHTLGQTFNNSIEKQNKAQDHIRKTPYIPQCQPPLRKNLFPSIVQQPTPVSFQQPTNVINAAFSNSSATTEINKNILLNQYLNQQYEAVNNEKNSTNKQLKYVDFNAEEAFQICTYKKIGEMINESLINEAVNKFECCTDATSSIQEQLREIYIKRKNEVHNVIKEQPKFPIKKETVTTAAPTNHKPSTFKPINVTHKSKLTNKEEVIKNDKKSKKIVNPRVKNYLYNEKPRANDSSKCEYNKKRNILNEPILRNDMLSHRKENDIIQFTRGNDNVNYLSSHDFKGSRDWDSSTSLSPHCNRNIYNRISDFKEHPNKRPVDERSDPSMKSYNEFNTNSGKKIETKPAKCGFENRNMPFFAANIKETYRDKKRINDRYDSVDESSHEYETNLWKKSVTKPTGFYFENSNVPRFSPGSNNKEITSETPELVVGSYEKLEDDLLRAKAVTKPTKFDFEYGNAFSPLKRETNLGNNDVMNSPSLFFCDKYDSPVTPPIETRVDEASRNNHFTFDSIVAKRKLEPEDEKLFHPIKFLKSTVGCSQAHKQKRKRKKIKMLNPAYSDSTYYGVNPFCRKTTYEEKPFRSKLKKPNYGLHETPYLFS